MTLTPYNFHFTLLKITNYTQCQVDFHMHVPLKKTLSLYLLYMYLTFIDIDIFLICLSIFI